MAPKSYIKDLYRLEWILILPDEHLRINYNKSNFKTTFMILSNLIQVCTDIQPWKYFMIQFNDFMVLCKRKKIEIVRIRLNQKNVSLPRNFLFLCFWRSNVFWWKNLLHDDDVKTRTTRYHFSCYIVCKRN